MKILFAGTDDFALSSLREINKSFQIEAVLTKPESKNKNRKKQTIPIKELALELGIKNIFQFEELKKEERKIIENLEIDTLVCVSYGKIFGPKFLSLFKNKLNLHPSKLPKYRGPSPIEEAILNDDDYIGICVQDISLKMDCGDLYKESILKLDKKENIIETTERASKVGAELLIGVLDEIRNKNKIEKKIQNENEATYCKMINKDDYIIDWNSSGSYIERMIRAYYPSAFTTWNGKILFLLEADFFEEDYDYEENGKVLSYIKNRGILIKTKDGILVLKKLKIQNKNEVNASDFVNGNKSIISSKLGD